MAKARHPQMGSFGKNRQGLPVGQWSDGEVEWGRWGAARPMANPRWLPPVGNRLAQKATKKELRLLRSLLLNV